MRCSTCMQAIYIVNVFAERLSTSGHRLRVACVMLANVVLVGVDMAAFVGKQRRCFVHRQRCRLGVRIVGASRTPLGRVTVDVARSTDARRDYFRPCATVDRVCPTRLDEIGLLLPVTVHIFHRGDRLLTMRRIGPHILSIYRCQLTTRSSIIRGQSGCLQTST